MASPCKLFAGRLQAVCRPLCRHGAIARRGFSIDLSSCWQHPSPWGSRGVWLPPTQTLHIPYPAEGGYVPTILAENRASSLESKPRMLDVGWGILAKPLESLKNRST